MSVPLPCVSPHLSQPREVRHQLPRKPVASSPHVIILSNANINLNSAFLSASCSSRRWKGRLTAAAAEYDRAWTADDRRTDDARTRVPRSGGARYIRDDRPVVVRHRIASNSTGTASVVVGRTTLETGVAASGVRRTQAAYIYRPIGRLRHAIHGRSVVAFYRHTLR